MDHADPKPNGESIASWHAQYAEHTRSPDASVTTASLEAILSTEQRELMDLVDRLRRAGLSSVLQLPQIVVCGDQSSGKSSVLEAITEIPFPRKANLCTRFATEIIMRRDAVAAISCKINPDSDRTDDEKVELRKFSRAIEDFAELPSLIDDATAAMGLGEQKAFGKDVLSIEICGPKRPQLTLVDLPGLIHSPTGSQSDEDVKLVKSLVEGYIAEKRTIILAVVSAKNDYANQVILNNCRAFDPKGSRTLGVITKPDYLRPGSENEQVWLELANNKDIFLELGWHLLKNRDDRKDQLTLTERNVEERLFFNTGSYQALPQRMKGIDTLCERLSQLLFSHLKRELPALKQELDSMAKSVQTELQSLGRRRATISDQRAYLAEFFDAAYEIVVMGVNGNYDSAFFGGVDIEAPVVAEENTRLRTVVQQLNIQFARRMQTHGHKYSVQQKKAGGVSLTTQEEESKSAGSSQPMSLHPVQLTREQAIYRVVQILKRTRGREIPGTFNPMLISHLFWDQSERWNAIAREHASKVYDACGNFLRRALNHVAAPELKSGLLSFTVEPVLKRAREAAFNELMNIMKDTQRHPMTYNHYFTDTLQKGYQERVLEKVKEVAQKAVITVNESEANNPRDLKASRVIRPETLHQGLEQAVVERDMDRYSAEQALDEHDAYYKAERKYFIDVVTKQVIERHLIAPLADVFSSKAWTAYSDKEIESLASEQPKTVQMREHLEGKKKILEEGQQAFEVAMSLSV